MVCKRLPVAGKGKAVTSVGFARAFLRRMQRGLVLCDARPSEVVVVAATGDANEINGTGARAFGTSPFFIQRVPSPSVGFAKKFRRLADGNAAEFRSLRRRRFFGRRVAFKLPPKNCTSLSSPSRM